MRGKPRRVTSALVNVISSVCMSLMAAAVTEGIAQSIDILIIVRADGRSVVDDVAKLYILQNEQRTYHFVEQAKIGYSGYLTFKGVSVGDYCIEVYESNAQTVGTTRFKRSDLSSSRRRFDLKPPRSCTQ